MPIGKQLELTEGDLFECEQCGVLEVVTGPSAWPWVVVVQVADHAGGRVRAPRILCAGCHDLLETAGAVGKGGGRC